MFLNLSVLSSFRSSVTTVVNTDILKTNQPIFDASGGLSGAVRHTFNSWRQEYQILAA